MKRITLLFALCYFVLPAKSQISLLKEIDGLSNGAAYDIGYFYTFTKEQLCIYDVNNLNNVKTINFPFIVRNLFSIGTNVFTNSGLWEYLITDNNYAYIYDENGTQLLKTNHNCLNYYIVKDKLILFDSSNPTSIASYIYQLSGQKTKLSEVRESASSVYPNPATDHLNINYTISKPEKLQVYNSSGQLVDSATLEPNNDTFILGTTNYPQGHYIYKYGNVSGKFIVK